MTSEHTDFSIHLSYRITDSCVCKQRIGEQLSAAPLRAGTLVVMEKLDT